MEREELERLERRVDSLERELNLVKIQLMKAKHAAVDPPPVNQQIENTDLNNSQHAGSLSSGAIPNKAVYEKPPGEPSRANQMLKNQKKPSISPLNAGCRKCSYLFY